jgi:flagellar assembly factor FliW
MTEVKVVSIQTERFGEVKVPQNEIITFPEGLLGFADHKQFVIIQEEAYLPFLWMQSAEDPHLCFVVVNPLEFMPDYKVEVKPLEIAPLDLSSPDKAQVLVIVVVREDPTQITANLQGPLLINPESRIAKQVVLLTERYHTRHYILQEAERHSAMAETGKED